MINIRISSNPWRRPGPPVYFEGAPSLAEAERDREAAAASTTWQPAPEAYGLLTELRAAVGQTVVVQAWDPVMFYMEDEGPVPIRARLRDVITRNDKGEERAFLVLDGSRPEEPQLFDVADLYELTLLNGPPPPVADDVTNQHTQQSSYREKLIEHLFIGELLKLSWLHHDCSLEVAKPEVDNSGYDIIAEANGIVRHIQVKSSIVGGKTASQKVHAKLAEKPSGCVVWIYFDEKTLALGPFLYYGAEAGKPMPGLSDRKVAKHTKGNKDGFKAERPNIRVLPRGAFKEVSSIKEIYAHLFQVAKQPLAGDIHEAARDDPEHEA